VVVVVELVVVVVVVVEDVLVVVDEVAIVVLVEEWLPELPLPADDVEWLITVVVLAVDITHAALALLVEAWPNSSVAPAITITITTVRDFADLRSTIPPPTTARATSTMAIMGEPVEAKQVVAKSMLQTKSVCWRH